MDCAGIEPQVVPDYGTVSEYKVLAAYGTKKGAIIDLFGPAIIAFDAKPMLLPLRFDKQVRAFGPEVQTVPVVVKVGRGLILVEGEPFTIFPPTSKREIVGSASSEIASSKKFEPIQSGASGDSTIRAAADGRVQPTPSRSGRSRATTEDERTADDAKPGHNAGESKTFEK